VGGTFTDLVAFHEKTGELLNIKVPSVPRNPEEGVLSALRKFLEDREPGSVKMVGHATTIATNVLFGQIDLKLPRTAMITTKGFRDVIEIGRQRRAEVYNLFFMRPPMLVSRRHRYEVEEKVDATGRIITPLNKADVEKALDDMEIDGVESLAIGFINSYANKSHEEEVLRMARDRLPKVHLSASSVVSSGYREYERFSTAAVNATLIPIIHTYLSNLAVDLKAIGIDAPLYVMQSNGGMAKAEIVSDKPVTIVESGPASGVIAAAWLGDLVDRREVISFDMGGTTAKAGTVRGRVPEVIPEYEVAGKVHMGRLLKGSGYPVNFPFIDLAECSAGGGTIAWADKGGALNVGPISAGANPGPACYGKGGNEPTITDANLVLGRLNPVSLLGGDMQIHPQLARSALKRLGDEVGVGVKEVAAGVVKIANSIMSKILRIVSVERGFDPRRFVLVAFGGAGPMHACPLAEELQIGDIFVPPNPGMFSALGLLTADLFHDYSRALVRKADEIEPSTVEELFLEMGSEGRMTLVAEGVEPGAMRFQRQLDLRYLGQSYELTVDVATPFNKEALNSSIEAFHRRHGEIYGYSAADEPVEFVSVRLRAVGAIPEPHLAEYETRDEMANPTSRRIIYFEGPDSWVETPVYERGSLSPGNSLEGPAVIEQYDSTTVVYPCWEASVDGYGILSLRRVVQ
jgi:N-methylhydantoinase A